MDRFILFAYERINYFRANSQNSLYLCSIDWLDFSFHILYPSWYYGDKSIFSKIIWE